MSGRSLHLLARLRYAPVLAVLVVFVLTLLIWQSDIVFTSRQLLTTALELAPLSRASQAALADKLANITSEAQHFRQHPLGDEHFGEMGRRVRAMRDWVQFQEAKRPKLSELQLEILDSEIEAAMLAAFPFLQTPTNGSRNKTRPFATMRARHVPGSRGIVIPAGRDTFRYACHLVTQLRTVLQSRLPIQVMYAGDDDLPAQQRQFITELGADIEPMDVTAVLDNARLRLKEVGWSIKPFALLVSRFEQTILLDADAVFLQPPEAILDRHAGYRRAGALLFHDRLLWQGAFAERHAWWERQLAGFAPSVTLNKSKVYNDGYAEDGDSGVVALHLGRLEQFMGLLHICWQNSPGPRKTSYSRGHGDKETWWLGLELSGAPYVFEAHYGAIVGHVVAGPNGTQKVCGFTIAHADGQGALLWYNGGLLKNKVTDPHEFDVPDAWMVDATWEKGATKADLSCMVGGPIQRVPEKDIQTIRRTVERAKQIDLRLREFV